MKYLKTLIALIIVFVGGKDLFAQCNSYFPMQQGRTWAYENYNAKEKVIGSQEQTVVDYKETDSGFESKLHVKSFDKKGKDLNEGDLEIICDNGTLFFDMRNFIAEEQLKAFESYEMEIESKNLEYPDDMAIGDELEDGEITMTAKGAPLPVEITVRLVNRVVLGNEKIKTPAGEFDAIKISSNSIVESKMGISMKFEFKQVEFLSKEVGMVKSETYRKGKLESFTLLTKFE